jgi:hypothetical protein
MNKIIDFIKRHSLWLIAGALAIFFLDPSIAEIKTLLLIISAEILAIALSGFAHFVYTKIDFTKDDASMNLGMIFLGVHSLVGLTILGVYIAQYCN